MGVGSHDKTCPRYDHMLWRVFSWYRPKSWWPNHDLIECAMPLHAVYAVRRRYNMNQGAVPVFVGSTWSKIHQCTRYEYEVEGRIVRVEPAWPKEIRTWESLIA